MCRKIIVMNAQFRFVRFCHVFQNGGCYMFKKYTNTSYVDIQKINQP